MDFIFLNGYEKTLLKKRKQKLKILFAKKKLNYVKILFNSEQWHYITSHPQCNTIYFSPTPLSIGSRPCFILAHARLTLNRDISIPPPRTTHPTLHGRMPIKAFFMVGGLWMIQRIEKVNPCIVQRCQWQTGWEIVTPQGGPGYCPVLPCPAPLQWKYYPTYPTTMAQLITYLRRLK